MSSLESRQVSWWSVHEFVAAAIDRAAVKDWPVAGTPAWCALADSDPRKLAAILVNGEYWSLRDETSQQMQATAASDIAAGTDNWGRVASEMRSLAEFRAARPWMKRVSA